MTNGTPRYMFGVPWNQSLPFITHRWMEAKPGSAMKKVLFAELCTAAMKPSRKRRCPREEEKYTRLNWKDYVDGLTPKKFRRRFRMDLGCFNQILHRLRPELEKRSLSHRRGEPILAEHMLAMTLRWLAGGSYIDIEDVYRVSTSNCFKIFWRVVAAICKTYDLSFPFDERSLKKIEVEFRSRCRVSHSS